MSEHPSQVMWQLHMSLPEGIGLLLIVKLYAFIRYQDEMIHMSVKATFATHHAFPACILSCAGVPPSYDPRSDFVNLKNTALLGAQFSMSPT